MSRVKIVATRIALVIFLAASLPGAMFGQPARTTPQNGNVSFVAGTGNEIIGLSTKLLVPALPAKTGTLFLWPGLPEARRSKLPAN